MNHHVQKIKTHLETLTNVELKKMADNLGIDVPPDLERIFVIQELLEANEDCTFEGSQSTLNEFINPREDFEFAPQFAPLLQQYNVNYLEVLLRDPLWAFVYWEINALDRKSYESSLNFKGYFLHVIPLAAIEGVSVPDSFIVSVGNTDDSLRIYLSPEITLFQVNLCVNRKESREVIVSSRQIYVPKLLNLFDETLQNNQAYPILRLSGIEEFEILRNADKVPRTHRFFGI